MFVADLKAVAAVAVQPQIETSRASAS